MADLYSILGVKKTASADEIRTAYRKLAKTLHPDLHPGDKTAEEKFKSISAAYDLLSDSDKRARYDRGEIDDQGNERAPFGGFRSRSSAAGGRQHAPEFAGEDVGDFFDSFFGGFQSERGGRAGSFRARGPDVRYRIDVEFLDA
ncbi:MAG: DnaJ domain-containing protein, partial [Caulobacterales bacterium]